VGGDHTENVGKWPLDASGKDPVNEDGEKILRAAVSLRDSASTSLRANGSAQGAAS